MFRFVYLLALATTVLAGCSSAQSPGAAKATYLQIFYEGPGWLAGRRVLAYSPAFRGKTGEMVQETDSTRRLAPNALLSLSFENHSPTTTTLIESTSQAAVALRRAEVAGVNQSFRMLEKRADLARATLGRALDETAADGWEVVQMTAIGNQGALVYLLRRP
ncbi:hypothetical protein [Hymenobacter coccineus]|uniref:DUF4136 domain-containing protein n=1 Tax=Hymenobacter coccineus TaxID=1908235 RepID=A0A1G1TH61_9BACT|nr:hypothetical protein [Hymenobacter coccineus]OGX90143.1 hypothetical protein BEN49_23750 [Hymenobacter coccineus]